MIAVDTNILVYAHRAESPHSDDAHRLVTWLAEGVTRWAVPLPCIAEFMCVATHPKLFDPPSTPEEAIAQVDSWLGSPVASVLAEGRAGWTGLREMVADSHPVGPRVYDARIAAICLDHRVSELWTVDRDFSRFPALRTRNPLVDSTT